MNEFYRGIKEGFVAFGWRKGGSRGGGGRCDSGCFYVRTKDFACGAERRTRGNSCRCRGS